jgi:conjugative relaxase-like TrwC/TraI family protein
VLRVAKLTNAEYVLAQVAGGLEDYYLGLREAPGVWLGLLPAQLGLVGVVEGDDLRALIRRLHPVSGEPLGGAKPSRVRALDATFSAPKSVSLLWAFGGGEVASVISLAHVEAVTAALRFVEQHAAVTRRQVNGQRSRAGTSGWAAATFMHRTSRAGDPQIHTHAVIPNMVCREDGSWVALDATALYGWAKAAGCVYQEELRQRLSERLGVTWGPDRNGCREMVGFTDAQLRRFSKRTIQIEDHLAEQGIEPGDAKARMRADEAASVATRPAKDRTLTPERLQGRWEAEAQSVGLATGEDLLGTVRTAGPQPARIARAQLQELFDRLVDPVLGLCAREARFGEAQVIEAIAAWGAGRLNTCHIEALARGFLSSDRVVRLVNRDSSGRAPGQWSTIAHRRVEDAVLDRLTVLQQRPAVGVDPAMVATATATAAGLGADQRAAVEVLCGPGVALRALISPAGYGKTTTLAAATDAVGRAGRPVIALSTTNQAVDQLRRVGISAMTVARFALETRLLKPGTVVVVDEFSQLSTRDAQIVLTAAAGCPDATVWMVGDPLQAQPVAAGGLAHWIDHQARAGRIPVAELTVNRRQADPIERHALAEFRHGRIVDSQSLRDDAGWEHHHADRDHALDAMAAAVLDDLDRYGPDRVAALAVSHADCEAIADRLRTDLAERNLIAGPALDGPGWAGPRHYRAGDRILLHAHGDLDNQTRLRNGTVATVSAVTADGLTVTTDRHRDPVVVPAGFVTGRGPDGRPNLSHAWARTIDGVQGGTWDQVHLLATPALDRHRGYVGQSRSVQPTHTWNTTPAPHLDDGDHGGRLVRPPGSAAEQIVVALARTQPKTFAALDDPYRHDRHVRAELADHHAQLETRPPDVGDQLRRAEQIIAARQRDLHDALARLDHWQTRYDATGGLHALRPGRRDQHHQAGRQIEFHTEAVQRNQERLNHAHRDHQDLLDRQADGARFDRDNAWRQPRITELHDHLDRYWAEAVLDAVRDGHPAAYGTARLRAARHTLVEQIERLADRPAPTPHRPTASPLDDPLRALGDLDRAIKQTAEQARHRLPTDRPVPRADRPHPFLRHQPHHPRHRPEPPTRVPRLGL